MVLQKPDYPHFVFSSLLLFLLIIIILLLLLLHPLLLPPPLLLSFFFLLSITKILKTIYLRYIMLIFVMVA